MASLASSRAGGSAGELLRHWRQRRKLSQLELSLRAAVSSRHLSFVETGRARPSRELLLHLADRLEIPLRERNVLLLAAGYAPVYSERPLDADDLAPVQAAIDRFLRAHEPYPALVLDGRYTILGTNDAVDSLVAGVKAELLEAPANALRVTLHPEGMAPHIVNFAEWSGHLMHRLRRRAALSGDLELERLHDELAAYPGVALEPPLPNAAQLLVPLRLRVSGEEMALISTVSTFETAGDVTVEELAIEAFYPANAETANRLLRDVAP